MGWGGAYIGRAGWILGEYLLSSLARINNSMQLVVALCLLVGTAVAQNAQDPNLYLRIAPVVQRTEIRDEANQFSHSYTTRDGQTFVGRGILKPTPDGQDHVLVQEGSYSYYAPDGRLINTRYQADEFGFRAEGDHLPNNGAVLAAAAENAARAPPPPPQSSF